MGPFHWWVHLRKQLVSRQSLEILAYFGTGTIRTIWQYLTQLVTKLSWFCRCALRRRQERPWKPRIKAVATHNRRFWPPDNLPLGWLARSLAGTAAQRKLQQNIVTCFRHHLFKIFKHCLEVQSVCQETPRPSELKIASARWSTTWGRTPRSVP